MHNIIVFATEMDDAPTSWSTTLRQTTDTASAMSLFTDQGLDDETLVNYLEPLAGADWVQPLNPQTVEPTGIQKLAALLDSKVTLTPINDHCVQLTVSAEDCRTLLGQALDAAIETMLISRQMLAQGIPSVYVDYPAISGPDPKVTEARERIYELEQTVVDYGLSPRAWVQRPYIAVLRADNSYTVATFGKLVREAVSQNKGLNLLVATSFTGEYHA